LDVALRSKAAEELTEVLVDAEKAVALAPDDGGILDTRGQIYLALSRVDKAFADFEKAIMRGVNDAGTFYGRGRVHELKGNRDAAIADYRKALELIDNAGAALDDYGKYVDATVRERLTALGVPTSAAAARCCKPCKASVQTTWCCA
jgi:tetratricopeptide (TPR) repeat protein